MNEQFFEKILPTQGNLCVAGISKDGVILPRFTESVDEVQGLIDGFIAKGFNVYFTPGSYEGYRRTASDCLAVRSFFLDLDYMHGKRVYHSKEAAIADVERFRAEIDWPPPTLVDSGGGVHVYWIFEEDIPAEDWKEYAKRFKQLCLDHNLIIDEAVPADAARLMRVPGSLNYRYDPPAPAKLLSDVYTYPVDQLLAAIPEQAATATGDVASILAGAEKGLDEESRRIWEEQRKNFEFDFDKIAIESIEGYGCNQIKEALLNPATLPEPQWYAAVSVAIRCTNGMEAVHKLSEDYPGYSREETERKAQQSLENATGAHSCDAFETINPEGCRGCPHRNKFGKMGPISIGRTLRVAIAAVPDPVDPEPTEAPEEADEAGAVRQAPGTSTPFFPDFLRPFVRGVNGGIYYLPAPKHTKDGKMIQDDPELMLTHDLYPIKRLYSPQDGECMVMNLRLPNDGTREFLLPMRDVAAQDRLRSTLASFGVVFEPQRVAKIATYLMKWSTFLINTGKADVMHMQQGWTDGCKSFVLGTTEYEDGGSRHSPPSPWAKNIVKHLHAAGTYERWQESVKILNEPGFELHALMFLCGFASPLMQFSSVNGITVSAMGESGSGKTGALYAAMSIWGKPDDLTLNDSTSNALIQRMVNMKNLPFPLDEQSNLSPKDVSDILYKVSAGRSKLRMQASTNAERNQEFLTHLICLATVNQSLKDKANQFKADASAEEMRLLELTIYKPIALTEVRGKESFDALRRNYGHAGPVYVEKMMELGAGKIQQIVEEETARVIELFTAKSEYRFLINLGGVIFAAERIARAAGIISFDMDRIGKVIFRTLHELMHARDSDRIDHGAILGEFLAQNAQNTLIIRGDKWTTAPRGALVVRAEVEPDSDECSVFVSTSAIKKYLHERQIPIQAFEDALKAKGEGILKGKVKKKMATLWMAGVASTNINAYLFKMNAGDFADDNQSAGQAEVERLTA